MLHAGPPSDRKWVYCLPIMSQLRQVEESRDPARMDQSGSILKTVSAAEYRALIEFAPWCIMKSSGNNAAPDQHVLVAETTRYDSTPLNSEQVNLHVYHFIRPYRWDRGSTTVPPGSVAYDSWPSDIANIEAEVAQHSSETKEGPVYFCFFSYLRLAPFTDLHGANMMHLVKPISVEPLPKSALQPSIHFVMSHVKLLATFKRAPQSYISLPWRDWWFDLSKSDKRDWKTVFVPGTAGAWEVYKVISGKQHPATHIAAKRYLVYQLEDKERGTTAVLSDERTTAQRVALRCVADALSLASFVPLTELALRSLAITVFTPDDSYKQISIFPRLVTLARYNTATETEVFPHEKDPENARIRGSVAPPPGEAFMFWMLACAARLGRLQFGVPIEQKSTLVAFLPDEFGFQMSDYTTRVPQSESTGFTPERFNPDDVIFTDNVTAVGRNLWQIHKFEVAEAVHAEIEPNEEHLRNVRGTGLERYLYEPRPQSTDTIVTFYAFLFDTFGKYSVSKEGITLPFRVFELAHHEAPLRGGESLRFRPGAIPKYGDDDIPGAWVDVNILYDALSGKVLQVCVTRWVSAFATFGTRSILARVRTATNISTSERYNQSAMANDVRSLDGKEYDVNFVYTNYNVRGLRKMMQIVTRFLVEAIASFRDTALEFLPRLKVALGTTLVPTNPSTSEIDFDLLGSQDSPTRPPLLVHTTTAEIPAYSGYVPVPGTGVPEQVMRKFIEARELLRNELVNLYHTEPTRLHPWQALQNRLTEHRFATVEEQEASGRATNEYLETLGWLERIRGTEREGGRHRREVPSDNEDDF